LSVVEPSKDCDVSAVVVNFNGGERVMKCLAALIAQDTSLGNIFVIDNGSTDGSPSQIRASYPDVQVLELGENRGLPAARNAGLRLASSRLVLLIDNDVCPQPTCLRRLLRTYETLRPAVVCPRVLLLPESGIVQSDGAFPHFLGVMRLRHGYLPVERAQSQTAIVDGCIGACMLVDRALALEAGGFDELYFFYFEDLEFSLRLRALGHRFVCEPTAVVYHDRGAGTPGLSFRGAGEYPLRRVYLSTRHRILTLLIHYRTRTLLVLLPALLLFEISCLLLVLVQGWSRAWANAWIWQLQNWRLIRQRRKQAQHARILRDRELLVGGSIPFAPGFVRSRASGSAAAVLSWIVNGYWQIVHRWIG
jgi:GT2 family glycosyltransferase